MRKIILFTTLLLTINSVYSQCSDKIRTNYDEFDKSKTNETVISLRNQNGYEFNIEMSFLVKENNFGRTPFIRVSARITNEGSNPKELGNNPYIHFLFEDGSSETLYGALHFGNYFQSLIWIRPFDEVSSDRLKTFEAVKSKKLKAIRFNKDYDKFDFYLTNQQKDDIQQIFNCITN